MRRAPVSSVLAVGLIAVGCSADPVTTTAPSDPPVTSTEPTGATATTTASTATISTTTSTTVSTTISTTISTTTSTTISTTTSTRVVATGDVTSTPTSAPFTTTSDIAYLEIDGRRLTMDVYTPAGAGPWPVVVAFHGRGSKTGESTTAVAEQAAADGMLVFAPTWLEPNSFPPTVEIFGVWRNAATCAVAVAQQYAAAHGGDPAVTVLHGFSAGVGPALYASLQPIDDPIPGCAVDVAPVPVVGVVVGDGEYFLHAVDFDSAFVDDPAALQSEVAAATDLGSWDPDLDARFFVWAAASGTDPRAIEDRPDGSGWLSVRDPTGSIREDLGRLGQLDDGMVTCIDEAQLLALRLSEAGLEVTLEIAPGDHTTLDKVPRLVDALRLVARRPN